MTILYTPPERDVAWEWRYEAPLALVGVPTLDGRVLVHPCPRTGPDWAVRLPVPVLAFPRVSRAGDGQGGPDEYEGPLPVATIDRIQLRGPAGRGRGGELVAFGRFASGSPGDHYRGALAVDAVCLGVELTGAQAVPVHRGLAFEGWQVAGAHLVAESSWDRSLLSRPRVWRSPVGAP